MIDWAAAGFGALWVLGLGLVVAAMSIAYYLASQDKRRFRQAIQMPACRITIDLGLVFFCLGWTGSVSGTWERAPWAILALLFALQAWQDRKLSKV